MDSWWSWLQHGDAKAREKILNKINQNKEDISFFAQVGSLCGSKKQEQMAECLLDLLAGQVMHVRLCMVRSACWRKYVAVSDMLAWAALYSRLSGLMLSLKQDSSQHITSSFRTQFFLQNLTKDYNLYLHFIIDRYLPI